MELKINFVLFVIRYNIYGLWKERYSAKPNWKCSKFLPFGNQWQRRTWVKMKKIYPKPCR